MNGMCGIELRAACTYTQGVTLRWAYRTLSGFQSKMK